MMKMSYTLVVTVFSILLFGQVAFAQENTDTVEKVTLSFQAQLTQLPFPEDISGKPSRFGYLRKLLEVSSGAKKVLTSDNVQSNQAYIEARKTYIAAANENEIDKVNVLLDDTVKLMYKAIRFASSKQMLDRKKERDYKRKLLSVNALLEALDRIAIEKENTTETNQLKSQIKVLISQADSQVKAHKMDDAREILDEAYLLTKTGIENMRSGDVLVRELNFASPEEEYAYELDRNDTHQMLIKLLISKKLAAKPPAYKKKINARVEQAGVYRAQAEAVAETGDFESAIAELEKSTKELVRAIRMGGVFIPG